MLQDPQVLGNDQNKPHSLMSDPISTMVFHNMSSDLSNKILFKPINKVQCSFLTDNLDLFICTLLQMFKECIYAQS